MEFKDYQQKVLDTLGTYLDELKIRRAEAFKVEQVRKANPELDIQAPDFCKKAWADIQGKGLLPALRAAVPFSARTDGAGRFVPNVCLKVPTGGGKTLLATASLSRIMATYLEANTGFVLWIVPNEAIYTQTKKQLTNREHPYRQMLDRAAAGRVKILEKDDPLDRRDLDANLCIMLLMLQSANRETKETLRMFRDRGNVHGFFPASDDFDKHFELLQAIPNLDAYNEQDTKQKGSIAKDSLGNVLRLVQPVIIVDEGHKTYSKKAIETIYGFNPSFVLELSATPKDRPTDQPPAYANWLVDVKGSDLDREEMIKLPINVKVKAGDDWRDCLRESLVLLNALQGDSDKLQSNTSIYIRPILLVQVERTGKEREEDGFIHANHAKKFLLTAGLTEQQIAIKSADVNDLNDPEKQDLLSPTNQVRAIITKQALQEGWDCPFAYVLCSLSASKNMSAMTQLVGRILRQPNARKTGVERLDQCYVLCHHANTRDVVAGIKDSLEGDGMADLVGQVHELEGNANTRKPRKIARRKGFEKLEVYLPVVNWVDGEDVRPLDYENDILMPLDWSAIDLKPLADEIPTNVTGGRSQMTQISVTDGASGEFFSEKAGTAIDEFAAFDPVYATRMIADIVPNPWIAREMVGNLLALLKKKKFDDKKLGEMSSFIVEELRKFLIKQRDQLAETVFMQRVSESSIQFRLRTDSRNWRMPETMETERLENARKLVRKSTGGPVERSLFAPVFQDDYNGEEEDFALYLDEANALTWWHRNVAKAGQYYVQGWKKNKVYPDFIFAHSRKDGSKQFAVIETKGDQLEGNLDTTYKKKLLQTVTKAFKLERVKKAGVMELVLDDHTTVECELVLMSEWSKRLPKMLGK